MYTDMYDTTFNYIECSSNSIFVQKKRKINFEYNDTITFQLKLNDVDLSNPNSDVTVKLYDYEFNVIYTSMYHVSQIPQSKIITFIYNPCKHTSLDRGIYYCGAVYCYYDSDGNNITKTILQPNDCTVSIN